MASRDFVANGPDTSRSSGRITAAVAITCIVAATSGLIFGYDIGISGGVTTMEPFLSKFFPSILRNQAEAKTNMYCMYNSQILTFFTSSLYIAALAASLAASRLTAALGRRNVMLLGGFTFLAGAAIHCSAVNLPMLILGRTLLGAGVGFTNQATPVYLSEMAPPRWRGAFNVGFEFFIGIGILTANCINYIVSKYTWGWRVSVGLAAVPALVMIIGALIIPDTPSSLIERGRLTEAKHVLVKIRGTEMDVETELEELIRYSKIAKETNEGAFVTIFQRQYRPHLVMAIAVSFFQQVTGISIVPFYGPVLFHTVGFGGDSALIAAIIIGSVNLASNVASALFVDHFGRRFLLVEGGIQMFICQVGLTIVLGTTTGTSGTGHIPSGVGVLVVVLMCVYAAGFGWSWGPLAFLIPSEIFPMRIRMAGQSIGVAVNFAVTFVVSQTFLSMLCLFKYWAFIFYGGWIAVMTIFVVILLPETKGIPVDEMHVVWKKHWFWRRFV